MSQKLFIGGLPFSTSTDELGQLFNQVPGVESVAIATDRDTGQSRGFGFVEMAAAEEAQNAISQLNGRELDGRRITVELSNPQAARSGGGGGRPGGGRPGGGRPGGGRPGGGGGRESGYAHRPSKPVKW
jgi:RNA recognition motif-containing protein